MVNEYLIEVLLKNSEQIGFSLLAFLLAILLLVMFTFLITFLRSNLYNQRANLEDRRLERQQMTEMLNRALETMKEYSEINRRLEASFQMTSEAANGTARALESLASTFDRLSESVHMMQNMIKENRDAVQIIADNRRDVFVLVGPSGVIEAISERASHVFNKDSQKLVGAPFSWKLLNLSSYDGSPLPDDYLVGATLRSQAAFYNHLVMMIPNDMPRLWMRVNCEPYMIKDQVGALLSFKDTNRLVYQ